MRAGRAVLRGGETSPLRYGGAFFHDASLYRGPCGAPFLPDEGRDRGEPVGGASVCAETLVSFCAESKEQLRALGIETVEQAAPPGLHSLRVPLGDLAA